jgi:hypothetical protein
MTDQPQDTHKVTSTSAPQDTGALNGKSKPPAYYAYLLRLWRVTGMDRPPTQDQPAVWRASLQATRNGEILGFSSLNELCEFLRRRTGMPSDSDADEDGTRA